MGDGSFSVQIVTSKDRHVSRQALLDRSHRQQDFL
jgi:hypothetical protein